MPPSTIADANTEVKQLLENTPDWQKHSDYYVYTEEEKFLVAN